LHRAVRKWRGHQVRQEAHRNVEEEDLHQEAVADRTEIAVGDDRAAAAVVHVLHHRVASAVEEEQQRHDETEHRDREQQVLDLTDGHSRRATLAASSMAAARRSSSLVCAWRSASSPSCGLSLRGARNGTKLRRSRVITAEGDRDDGLRDGRGPGGDSGVTKGDIAPCLLTAHLLLVHPSGYPPA